MNHTNESHKRIAQDKMMSHPTMEISNNALGCSRATQVHMEYLRLVNLTEICPSRRVGHFKAPCCSGWMKTRVNNQTKIAGQDELTITLLFNNQTGLDCSYSGNRSRGTQQMKCVGNTDVFCFGFNFMSPKLTRTKLNLFATLPQEA